AEDWVYASASGALIPVLCSRWRSRGVGYPLARAPLPRAALNRGGAAMWLLYSFRRLGTSGPAFAPVAVLLSHVPVFRQLTRFSSIVCLQRLAPGPTQFCKP